jgi:hypothetical protein
MVDAIADNGRRHAANRGGRVLRALWGSPAGGPLIGVGHELTFVTCKGLLSGHLHDSSAQN